MNKNCAKAHQGIWPAGTNSIFAKIMSSLYHTNLPSSTIHSSHQPALRPPAIPHHRHRQNRPAAHMPATHPMFAFRPAVTNTSALFCDLFRRRVAVRYFLHACIVADVVGFGRGVIGRVVSPECVRSDSRRSIFSHWGKFV